MGNAYDPSPGPDRLIGQEWVDRGYPISPILDEVEDCPICGAPSTTCTEATHLLGLAMQQPLEEP
ncbi:hypothetical protein SEA_KABOCHA_37 [Gordonia phage Kabocha]|uniref:Uncharacterized protein n=1 Tax=Gordonia phage Chidiebere TaxID=2656530 RepID=A0A649VKN1_9CAUD|nr:hypothetical protein PQD14_gp036 [Gordonia phage Chidiebere]QGJ92927.1 hypothetical protein PBI_CHIDIEBERE_36 [Gordonia phage Chidiebere]WAA19824.1 hypothetical protein SEA_KABOCHA_37 [Gordonia phage Kabocha]WAA20014.1 hypothetical protein SEA_HANEM_36 [Gordonia phage Hanem]WNM67056.1 hypothetical protein SEA_SCHOMBER_35 [Gordonia Phage Schomber]